MVESKHPPADRAAKIYSVLQGTKYLTHPLSQLRAATRDAMWAAIADEISKGTGEGIGRRIIEVVGTVVPEFAQAWGRLATDGGDVSRLRIVETLARGEYH